MSDRQWALQEFVEQNSRFNRSSCQKAHRDNLMGSISVACYKPRPGREQELLELVRNHLPPLRAEGLVTDRTSIVMRCADGTIVEVFEWVSQEIIVGAHKNPVVLDLWKRFEALCWYETPANLPEFQNMFGHFEPI
jgi:hypothetical protein